MKTKKIKSLSLIVTMFLFVFSFAGIFAEESKKRLVDNADLLTSSQYESLLSKLDEISERQGCDVVILTEKSIGEKNPQDYADNYFDYNGYGIGKDRQGVLLLLNMQERDWRISTSGNKINAFTEKGIKYISNKFLPDLKDGDYVAAFDIFAEQCDKFLTQFKTEGKAYDGSNLPKEPLSKFWILGSVLLGVLASWLTVGFMKNQLKTVRKKSRADDYIRENSLLIKNARDIFLYSNITRTARPKSSSGSHTHTSSSGRTHGGGGGKF